MGLWWGFAHFLWPWNLGAEHLLVFNQFYSLLLTFARLYSICEGELVNEVVPTRIDFGGVLVGFWWVSVTR